VAGVIRLTDLATENHLAFALAQKVAKPEQKKPQSRNFGGYT
jgi:hypothetical protein